MSVPSVSGVKTYGRYLFEYRFDNAHWGLEIVASSPAEAEARIKALAWARYQGEVMARIPVPGATLITRIRAALSKVCGGLSRPRGG